MAPRRRAHRDVEHTALTLDAADTLPGCVPVVSCPAPCPLEVWCGVLDELLLRPESSNILRIDRLADLPLEDAQDIANLTATKRFRRRLRPSRPFDGIFDQLCTLYVDAERGEGLLLLEPDRCAACADEPLPYYHPEVDAIAYRYLECPSGGYGALRIDVRPRRGATFEIYEPASRTFRTALGLLTNVRKRCVNTYERSYAKRVHHDRLAPRDAVQDERTRLKARYAWALAAWREGTDPRKHVFEDIAIAAFLVVMWRDMYDDGRPPRFVDLGCGNGFLCGIPHVDLDRAEAAASTFILTSEGYDGFGVDLRSRKSWALWRERLPDVDLRTRALDMPAVVLDAEHELASELDGAFIIANHADELTPWISLIAARHGASGFLNLACCAHDLARPFVATRYAVSAELWPATADAETFAAATLETGGRYAAYVNRLAELTLRAGWLAERELLRIPSTRNAAVVGRRRSRDWPDVAPAVTALAESARAAGWQARAKDGRDH